MADEEINLNARLIDEVSGPLKEIADAAKAAMEAFNTAFEAMKQGFNDVETGVDAVVETLSTLNQNVVTIGQTMGDMSSVMNDAVVPSLKEISDGVNTTNTNLSTINGTIGGFTAALGSLQTPLTEVARSLVDDLVPGMIDLEGAVLNNNTALSTNTDALDALLTPLTDVATGVGALNTNIGELNYWLFETINATANLASKLTDTITAMGALQSAVQDNTTALIDNTDATEINTAALNTNSTNLKDVADGMMYLILALSDTSDAMKVLTDSLDANTAATAANTAAMSKLAAANASATASAKASADANAKAKTATEGAGYGAILGATSVLTMAGAAVRLGIDMVKAGADSEDALTRVAALTGTSAQQMDQYKMSIEQMAVTFGATIPDISAGLYDILSVGYTGQDAMNVLRESLMAAAAGGTDLHTVTNGLTSIMKAFAFSGNDAANAVDILMTGVREGKAPFADFSRAIGLVANVSHEAGFKIGEVTAALSTMTVVYPTVRQAGQNLQALITDIGIQTDKLATRAQKLKVPFDATAFSSMTLAERLGYLWNASGRNVTTFNKLMGTITATKAAFTLLNGADVSAAFVQLYQNVGLSTQQLEASAKKAGMSFNSVKFEAMNATDKIKYLSEISKGNAAEFGLNKQQTEALAEAFAYASGVGADFARNLAQMSSASDATKNAFEAHSKTMAAAMQRIQGAVSVLDMEFANAMAPIIIGVMNAVSGAFQSLALLFEEHSNIMIPLVLTLAAAIIGSLVGAMYALAGIMGGIMLEAAVVSITFSGIAIVLVAVGAGLKYAYDHSLPFRQAVDQLWGSIQQLAGALATSFNPALDAMRDLVKSASDWWNSLWVTMTPVAQTFMKTRDIVRDVNGHMRTFHDRIAVTRDIMQQSAGPLSIFLDSIKKISDYIKQAADDINRLFKPYNDYVTAQKYATTSTQDFNKHLHGTAPIFQNVAKHAAGVQNPVEVAGQKMLGFAAATAGIASLVGIAVIALAGFSTQLSVIPLWAAPVLSALAPISGIFIAIGTAVESFTTVVGPLLLYLVSQLGVWGALQAVLEAVASAIGGVVVGFAIASAPFIALAAVIAVIVGAVITAYNAFAGFRSIIAGLLGQVAGLGKIFTETLGPTLDTIHGVVVTNLLPAWKELVHAWQEASPVLAVLGAIIGTILAVLLSLLVGIVGGLIKALGPFISGLVEMFGAIIQITAGAISFIVDIISGIVKIIMAFPLLLSGNAKDFNKFNDIVKGVFGKLWTDLQNIFQGIVTGLKGIWDSTGGTILTFIWGFVESIIGFFQHLFDVLLGHSIIPDIRDGAIACFQALHKGASAIIHLFVQGAIFLFNMLMFIPRLIANIVVGIAKFLMGLLTNPLGTIKNFVGSVSSHLHQMSAAAFQHMGQFVNNVANGAKAVLSLAPAPIKQAGTAIINHLQSAATGGLKAMDQLLNGTSSKAKMMADETKARSLMMQASMIGATINMSKVTLQHYESMRAGILDKLKNTTDPAKRAALELQLSQVNNAIAAENGTIASAERKRQQVVAAAQDEMKQASEQARLAKENVVQRFLEMGVQAFNHVRDMVTNILGHIVGMASALIQRVIFMKNQFIDHIRLLISNADQQFLDWVKKVPGYMVNMVNGMIKSLGGMAGSFGKSVTDFMSHGLKSMIFHSPAEEGPGRDADKWMPNLVNMMADGLNNGQGTMKTAGVNLMQSLKNSVTQTGAQVAVAGTQAVNPSAIAAGNGVVLSAPGSGQQNVTVTINVNGGLGAGLQLLNPTDRATFAKQIADEMGRETRLQGNFTNGYSNK